MASTEQELNRSRFKIVRSHISRLNSVIRIGYNTYSYPKRAYDAAMSYNLRAALIEQEDGFVIDWQKFMIAKGSPNPMTSYTMDFNPDKLLFQLSWEYDAYLEKKFDTRSYVALLILYSPADDRLDYHFLASESNASLASGKQWINIPENKKLDTYEAFIFFVASYGGGNTDSMYLGQVQC